MWVSYTNSGGWTLKGITHQWILFGGPCNVFQCFPLHAIRTNDNNKIRYDSCLFPTAGAISNETDHFMHCHTFAFILFKILFVRIYYTYLSISIHWIRITLAKLAAINLLMRNLFSMYSWSLGFQIFSFLCEFFLIYVRNVMQQTMKKWSNSAIPIFSLSLYIYIINIIYCPSKQMMAVFGWPFSAWSAVHTHTHTTHIQYPMIEGYNDFHSDVRKSMQSALFDHVM